MAKLTTRTTSYGGLLMFVAALAAVVIAIYDFVNTGNGIAYSYGAGLVLVVSVLILLGALVMVFLWNKPAWLSGILYVLLLLGILGNGFAAYMLAAYWLAIAMVVALIGWFVHATIDASEEERAKEAVRKEVLS
ncbi:hypothetical protein [Pararhizobium mangrovi]|uniref:Uncharacterized protein n=1 Tax=Pararhizobium mangrovi TaxID=2590452 RepID=A0A506U5K2_9HYPH|nr:hypothetical protein [Pararhizobium mangrovi]TPW29633.1 hypothetical protein FJU11_07280 [Pararhizobium mangrovi]